MFKEKKLIFMADQLENRQQVESPEIQKQKEELENAKVMAEISLETLKDTKNSVFELSESQNEEVNKLMEELKTFLAEIDNLLKADQIDTPVIESVLADLDDYTKRAVDLRLGNRLAKDITEPKPLETTTNKVPETNSAIEENIKVSKPKRDK